jgi:hypothetical protein
MDAVELVPGPLLGDRLLDQLEMETQLTPLTADASGARTYGEASLGDVEAALDRLDGEWRDYVSLTLL